MPSLISKIKAETAGGTMSLTVTKTGGVVVTRAAVGSTGTDDRIFEDKQLTPGPATMPLKKDNSYSIVWFGAFVSDAAADLAVLVKHADDRPDSKVAVKVKGKAGDTFFRVVIVP